MIRTALIVLIAVALGFGVALGITNYFSPKPHVLKGWVVYVEGTEVTVQADEMVPAGACSEFYTEGRQVLRLCLPHAIKPAPVQPPADQPKPAPDPNAPSPSSLPVPPGQHST
jgi:hypothetical protein